MRKRIDARQKPFLKCHHCKKPTAPKDASYVRMSSEANFYLCGKCTAKDD